MKTAQRILSTSLALFNDHGEAAISSVDIANECDISPGNLYYHFKGKEQLVMALMKLHRQQMDEILDKNKIATLEIDELFFYLFLVIQRIHLFRFLYRSPADLMEKYPQHQQQYSRFLKQLNDTLSQLFTQCANAGGFSLKDTSSAQISTLTSLIITQSCQYDHMIRVKGSNQEYDSSEYEQYHCLSLLITALLPRCSLSPNAATAIVRALELHDLPSFNHKGWSQGI
ncbi:TetR family transcriptional regulator [Alteromonas sp. 5E99-2]|uniref:TetR/AcrR family transcriptional regulator n=1 Tax=Alteromonas sp. 5E99-2 TaxID=2817683 RepID=UPI001A9872BD|nr:TetR family transcriptional regulator [Alteromonas sp. 5E99-2]